MAHTDLDIYYNNNLVRLKGASGEVCLPNSKYRYTGKQARHREKGARYALMAYPGKERDPGTHMTDIYRHRGRSVHLSSRSGADVDHDHFF